MKSDKDSKFNYDLCLKDAGPRAKLYKEAVGNLARLRTEASKLQDKLAQDKRALVKQTTAEGDTDKLADEIHRLEIKLDAAKEAADQAELEMRRHDKFDHILKINEKLQTQIKDFDSIVQALKARYIRMARREAEQQAQNYMSDFFQNQVKQEEYGLDAEGVYVYHLLHYRG